MDICAIIRHMWHLGVEVAQLEARKQSEREEAAAFVAEVQASARINAIQRYLTLFNAI
jgi:hypothetical protein